MIYSEKPRTSSGRLFYLAKHYAIILLIFYLSNFLKMVNHHKLIILGFGPAGYTSAIYAARANLKLVIITGMQPGDQLTTTTDVDWPGEPNGIMGSELINKITKTSRKV